MATTLTRFPSATAMAMAQHQSVSRPSSTELSYVQSDANEFFSGTASHAYFHHDVPASQPATPINREDSASTSAGPISSFTSTCMHLQRHLLSSEAHLSRLGLAAAYSAQLEHAERSQGKTRHRKVSCVNTADLGSEVMACQSALMF